MKKLVSALLAAVAPAVSPVTTAYAAVTESEYTDAVSGIRFSTFSILSEHRGITDAAVQYTDPQFKQKSPILQSKLSLPPVEQISEIYDHSVYSDAGTSITGMEPSPRENDIFLVSTARGSSNTITEPKQISASLQISGVHNSGIASLVKLAVIGTASGELIYVWPNSKVYTAPETVPFHRDYYGAVQYVPYSTQVRQTDIYKQYYKSIYIREVQHDRGIVETVSSKAPKTIEYSIDF
ncbi:hypothetical protein [Paenibacillus chitinolyticus]|uniref:hypothetical protein n=1 Tax=Paenibacillus chitinolyticus TaxID=79263 RepID=UPI001C45AF21|nr:hypothetical protein [Paenibacillus chitinolyticus]MBV6714908.1 hypothetical protein [Paenibacillus chitinolyticus]